MSKKTVYVSGPITHHVGEDPFGPVASLLEALGHTAVNPKTIGKCHDESCVKLPHEIERGWDHSWACCLKYDLAAMLMMCDAILMLDGWQDSHGARLELTVASAVGLDVMMQKDLYR